MSDTQKFAAIVLVVGAVVLLAVVSNRLSEWVRLPAPALVLVGAVITEKVIPVRTLASALMLHGIATQSSGSGFLAVFVEGIILEDARAPYKREIERFHSALASLAEIVVFVILGLTV